MNAQTLDMGMGILGATRGLIGQYNYQGLVLADMLGRTGSLDSSGIDSALSSYQAFQAARNVALASGFLYAGAKFAQAGMGRFARGAASALGRRGFSSFKALKAFLGSPGPGNVWHHIVEQSQIRGSGAFRAERIQSVENVVAIPGPLNARLNGYYSSIRAWTNGMRVRDYLKRHMSFDEQFEFGKQRLSEFGGI
jgi:hypothetical protein